MIYTSVISMFLASLFCGSLVSGCAKRKACSQCHPGFVQLEADQLHGQQNLTTVLGPLDSNGCATLNLACSSGLDDYIMLLSSDGSTIGVSHGSPAVATLICSSDKEWRFKDNTGNPSSNPVANAICYDTTPE